MKVQVRAAAQPACRAAPGLADGVPPATSRAAPTVLQIGLFGDIRKWQKDLEKLSELFDTEDEESLHYILQGRTDPSGPVLQRAARFLSMLHRTARPASLLTTRRPCALAPSWVDTSGSGGQQLDAADTQLGGLIHGHAHALTAQRWSPSCCATASTARTRPRRARCSTTWTTASASSTRCGCWLLAVGS